MISSPHNPRVKLFRSLAEAKHRRETGLFALEGRRLIEEALRAQAEIIWAAYCPETFAGVEEDRLLRGLLDAGVEIVEIAPRALAAMSHTETPPGIAAVARIPEAARDLVCVLRRSGAAGKPHPTADGTSALLAADAGPATSPSAPSRPGRGAAPVRERRGRSAEGGPRALQGRDAGETPAPLAEKPPQQPPPGGTEVPLLRETAWLLGLWQLRDPGNLGAMIRTAHAFGAAAVVAVGSCVDFYDPKVVRASAGSLLHLPLLRLPNLYALREALAAAKTSLVVADQTAFLACDEADYPPRSLLLVGSEAHGLPEEVLAAADLRVSIPMPGGAESLNAAVAAGIIAFHLSRAQKCGDSAPARAGGRRNQRCG